MRHLKRIVAAMAVWLLFFCAANQAAAAPAPKPADSAAALLATVTGKLANGELDEALAAARKAAALHPANYRTHYYTAFVLYKLKKLDDAQAAVQEALHLAPDEARPELQRLSQAVKAARATNQAAALADAAQAEGLNGKAANLWKQAWEAGYQHAEHGFAAAQAYATTLGQPVLAAQILREIAARSADPDSVEKAARLLDQLAPVLSTIAASQFQAAQQAGGPARQQLLREVLDADPGFIPAYELRALTAAETRDLPAFKETLRDLSRRNKLDPAMLRRAEFAPLMRDPAMAGWLNDLLGTVGAQQVLAGIAAEDEQRAAQRQFEQVQRAYQGSLQSYQLQLAEHHKYLPCLEEAQARQHSCEQQLPPARQGIFGIGGNGAKVEALRLACIRQSRESVARCGARFPAEPPVEPKAPVALSERSISALAATSTSLTATPVAPASAGPSAPGPLPPTQGTARETARETAPPHATLKTSAPATGPAPALTLPVPEPGR